MERKTDELLKQLEIEHLAERNTNELSSGEARRVLIARALIHSPKALVLDEPTTSLDFHATHELREILRKIAQAGTSMVMVTHHLPDIIPEISRVIVMKDGRVSLDGPKADVLTSETLSDLFQISAEVVERDGYYQVW
jgi:iron complex transport system ATP-binding protein